MNTMYSIINGDCEKVLSTYSENTFHSCICDPPYGIGLDHWDYSIPPLSVWKEVYNTLRPGAFCLAFCDPTLYHRLAINIEDAGFNIKDMIFWMTTTKMPKHNRLKPAHEPIVVAQKPYKSSLQSNYEEWGCGLINVNDTRIPWDKKPPKGWTKGGINRRTFGKEGNTTGTQKEFGKCDANPNGRYPSNIIGEVNVTEQKYFYAPRATRKEKGVDNDHPTVKPVALMEYLIKIYSPINSKVLDPFCGSGSTGVAAIKQEREFIGIELDPEYVKIAENRLSKVTIEQPTHNPLLSSLN